MSVKKILVISDTHKNISNAIDIILRKKPDYVLHLGDLTDDADEIKHIFEHTEVIGVCGNCDWGILSDSPTERVIDVDGVKIMMCHGHTYGVKSGVDKLVEAARLKQVNVALYGHSHIPNLNNFGDLIIMNPGSVNTYGWIEISNGKINAGMFLAEE